MRRSGPGPKRYRDPTPIGSGAGSAARVQEDRVAQATGGRRQRGSGSWAGAKGDVVCEQRYAGVAAWLVECKRTQHASLGVRWDWLVKVTREAWAQGRLPALAVEIAGGSADPGIPRDWVMIPLEQFRRLTEGAGDGEQQ